MRSTLIAALIASLVIHLALLFGAEIELSLASAPSPMPLQAELKAPAAKPASGERSKQPAVSKKKPRLRVREARDRPPATPAGRSDSPPRSPRNFNSAGM